jgi:hypothetical protein
LEKRDYSKYIALRWNLKTSRENPVPLGT